MTYHTVFDITHVGLKNWYGTLFFLAFLVIWILVMRPIGGQPFWSKRPGAFRVFVTISSGFIALLAILDCFFTHLHHNNLRREFEEGRFSLVDGVVSEFSPETLGRKRERFCVRGHCFTYSQSLSIPGFNDSNEGGGPIREGLPVRVSYVGEQIVKLEVGR
jgi:hypothetical protein